MTRPKVSYANDSRCFSTQAPFSFARYSSRLLRPVAPRYVYSMRSFTVAVDAPRDTVSTRPRPSYVYAVTPPPGFCSLSSGPAGKYVRVVVRSVAQSASVDVSQPGIALSVVVSGRPSASNVGSGAAPFASTVGGTGAPTG